MAEQWEAPQASTSTAVDTWEAPQASGAAPASAPAPAQTWEAPQVATYEAPQAAPQGHQYSEKANKFFQNYTPPEYKPDAISMPNTEAKLAKAGTVGEEITHSDAQRQYQANAGQAQAFRTSTIRSLYLNPQFRALPQADKDAKINELVTAWAQQGFPGGEKAWLPESGSNFIPEMLKYAKAFESQGGRAQEPGMHINQQGKLVVAKSPEILGSETLGAAGVSAAQAAPGIFGGSVSGEAGAALGEMSGLPGGAIAGGLIGSIAGAAGADKYTRELIEKYGNEDFRNAVENLDDAAAMAQQEHPFAAAAGRFGTQLAHNPLAIGRAVSTRDFSAFKPHIGGAAVGGAVEAGSELGRGEDLDPYRIGEAAFSGSFAMTPDYMRKGVGPLNYNSRPWQDTNGPRIDLMQQVHAGLMEGKKPVDIMAELGHNLPDTPKNRKAIRNVAADIRADRDPSGSLKGLKFRPDGLTVDQTIQEIGNHTDGWDPDLNIHVHDSFDSDTIPARLRDKVGPGTLGFKDDAGDIHIIASQHADPEAVKATLFHEGMHAGVARLYQEGLEDKFVHLYDNGNARFREALGAEEAIQAEHNPDWEKLSDSEKKALVVDEVLAGSAENGLAKGEFDSIKSWIKDFGRKHLGEFGRNLEYSDAEIRHIMTTGFDKLKTGDKTTGPVRFLNFGQKSLTSDDASLESYGGNLPDRPEYEQGWFRGQPDNKPRYEVSDAESSTDVSRLTSRNSFSLPEVFKHPTLYDAYPHMRNIQVKMEDSPGNLGSWDRRNTIYINPRGPNPHATMVHEIQHAIQTHEGWAEGSNTAQSVATTPIQDLRTAVERKADFYRNAADNYSVEYYTAKKLYEEHPKEIDELRQAYQLLERHLNDTGGPLSDPNRPSDEMLRHADQQITAAIREWQTRAEEMGIEHDDFHRAVQQLIRERRPPQEAIDNLRHEAEKWAGRGRRAESFVDAPEHAIRNYAKDDPTLSSDLYYRAGGEYEARQAASRIGMSDKERLDKSQYEGADEQGVTAAETYVPQGITRSAEHAANDVTVSPIASDSPDGEQHDFHVRGEDGNVRAFGNVMVDQYGRLGPVTMFDAQTHEPIDVSPEQAQAIRDKTSEARSWMEPVGNDRFSRKYSGTFGKDYDSRQKRTKDVMHAHFGNFSINAIRGMMRPLEEYKGKTRAEMYDAAQELKNQGFNADIAIVQGAIPDNAAFVIALKDLVREKLEAASEVAGRYRSSGGMRHERELMSAVTELGQVMAVFDKTASNLGRMLYSLRMRLASAHNDEGFALIMRNIRFANGQLDAAAMDDIAKALISKNPTDIRKSIDKFDPDWKHYAQSLFYNSLLGTKSVQFGNVLGNATNIIRGGVADVLGYGAGLGREGLAKVRGKKFDANTRMHSEELFARAQGILAGLLNYKTYDNKRALNTAVNEFFLKAGESQHENKFVSQSIDNRLLSVPLEWGTRGVQATDAFFRTAIEHSAMQGLATREARRLNGGRKPNQQMVAELMASPTRKMLSDVAGEADRLLFQEDPFKAAEKFSQLIRSVPGAWILAPFVRTPANIGRTAIEAFDPTGRVSERNRAALKSGTPEADRVRGQQVLATALWAGTVYLMQQGMIHGSGPKDANERAQWLLNNQPNSIGNKQTGFIPMKSISPLGDGLAIIADAYEGYQHAKKNPDMAMADLSLGAASAMANAFMTNSFASSVTDGISRGVQPTMVNLAGSLVKAAVSVPIYSEYKKLQDPYVRDTSKSDFLSTMEAKASLMNNPGAEHYFKGVTPRDEVPIKRDPFGAPIMADSPTSDDPVANELGRLVDSTGKAVIPGFDKTQKGMRIPNDLYNTFLAIAGPPMREVVNKIMQDPTYRKTVSDEQRAAMIRSNKNLRGLHNRLTKQLQAMMLERAPDFESNFIPRDKKTLSEIPE